MAYNKRAHLLTNTEAIRIALVLDRENRRATEAERRVLQGYSGFGGIKCILNPTGKETDKAYWTKSDLDLFPLVVNLLENPLQIDPLPPIETDPSSPKQNDPLWPK